MSNRALAVLIAVAIFFAAFVWPTMYRYDRIGYGPGVDSPVRINRFTGYTEILAGISVLAIPARFGYSNPRLVRKAKPLRVLPRREWHSQKE